MLEELRVNGCTCIAPSKSAQVIPNYGFECSDQGVEDMLKATRRSLPGLFFAPEAQTRIP